MLPRGLEKYVGVDSDSQVALWLQVTPHMFSASFLEAQKNNMFREQNKNIVKSNYIFPSLCDMVQQDLLLKEKPEAKNLSTPTKSTNYYVPVSIITLNVWCVCR
jgi:hypothetical protein